MHLRQSFQYFNRKLVSQEVRGAQFIIHESLASAICESANAIHTTFKCRNGLLMGGVRNLPIEELELPTGWLAWTKSAVPYVVLPNFVQQETKLSSDGGLDGWDGGL